MKLLKIEAFGLPLFQEKLVMTFYARQRVAEDDKDFLFPLALNFKYYMNCVNYPDLSWRFEVGACNCPVV